MSTSASSSNGSSGYPSSAVTLATALGLSNFDLAQFVPVGCLLPATTFYNLLIFKTLTPLVIVMLLCMRPTGRWITANDSARTASATRTAARWSLFLMEMIISSVSTTIVRTFSCTKFDDGWFLSAQLTIPCDHSTRRTLYLAYAWFMLLVYSVGVPLFVLVLMYLYRADIFKLVQALKEYDATHDTFTYTRELVALARRESSTRARRRQTASPQRRPSLLAQAVDINWLASKFDRFEPHCWWASSFLIAMRLLQTSALVFITNTSLQAAVASVVALMGISVQRTTMPFRRPSE